MYDGIIDLSHWQTPVDFTAVKASGIDAVLLKATQGASWVDPCFVQRLRQAEATGLLVGAYHFCDARTPIAQVTHFMGVAGTLPVLAIDIEANALDDTVTVRQAAEIAARIQIAHGRAPLVYIGRYGPDERGTGLPNSALSRCPLWLPNYNVVMSPGLPLGWTSWFLWQHTEDATVNGVGGPCDRSRFDGEFASLQKWWNSGNM